MFSLEIECDPDDRDFLIAELWEQGSAGIVELDGRRVRAFFEDAAQSEHLMRMYPGATLRTEEQRDWVESARELLQPMEAGARFFLGINGNLFVRPSARSFDTAVRNRRY